jgi:hypothetical protein
MVSSTRSRDSLPGAQATRGPWNDARNRVADPASFSRALAGLIFPSAPALRGTRVQRRALSWRDVEPRQSASSAKLLTDGNSLYHARQRLLAE